MHDLLLFRKYKLRMLCDFWRVTAIDCFGPCAILSRKVVEKGRKLLLLSYVKLLFVEIEADCTNALKFYRHFETKPILK